MKNAVGAAITIVAMLTGAVPSHAEGTSLRPQTILDSALARVNAAAVVQAGPNAREIESKRTIGLVKIIIGSICAVSGVSWLAAGGSAATIDGARGYAASTLIIGAGLGGGGAWLIYDGVQDRADAAQLEGSASLNFAPTTGGGLVTFSRGW